MIAMLPELEEVARHRKALGLTQHELADRANVSRSLIAKLETGKLTPNYAQAKRIFDLLEELEQKKGKKLKVTDIPVGEIHRTSVEYAAASETVYEVSMRMAKTAYSQFPVRDGERIVGSITERGINRRLVEEDADAVKSLPVRTVMEAPFPTVNVNIPASAVVNLLQACQAVLTMERDRVMGIVTNADLGKLFDQT